MLFLRVTNTGICIISAQVAHRWRTGGARRAKIMLPLYVLFSDDVEHQSPSTPDLCSLRPPSSTPSRHPSGGSGQTPSPLPGTSGSVTSVGGGSSITSGVYERQGVWIDSVKTFKLHDLT